MTSTPLTLQDLAEVLRAGQDPAQLTWANGNAIRSMQAAAARLAREHAGPATTDGAPEKIEQAAALLTAVRNELADLLQDLPRSPENDELVVQQQDAIAALNRAIRSLPIALAEVRDIIARQDAPGRDRHDD